MPAIFLTQLSTLTALLATSHDFETTRILPQIQLANRNHLANAIARTQSAILTGRFKSLGHSSRLTMSDHWVVRPSSRRHTESISRSLPFRHTRSETTKDANALSRAGTLVLGTGIPAFEKSYHTPPWTLGGRRPSRHRRTPRSLFTALSVCSDKS
jgi:hypothetical protein